MLGCLTRFCFNVTFRSGGEWPTCRVLVLWLLLLVACWFVFGWFCGVFVVWFVSFFIGHSHS